MKVEECYAAFGGNYEEVKQRLQSDALIQRLVCKFLDDQSYELLCEALEEEAYEDVFRAVHTLKGVSQNLSFQRLSCAASTLTELLRGVPNSPVDQERCRELWQQVSAEYGQVVEAVRRLQE